MWHEWWIMDAYRIFERMLEGKRPLVKPREGCLDNTVKT
jgi:hypothetical protein